MNPTAFPQANRTFTAPKEMPDCRDLHVHVGTHASGREIMTSKWRLTKEEMREIAITGTVWLTIMGRGHPPVALTIKDPWLDVASQ